jgi:hypothetical protein
MRNPFKKISKKTVLIASVLVILIGVPVLAYFYLNEETEDTSAWYDNSWLYRRSITVNNAGGTLTNEDVLITLDTATLVSQGKLQADCDDLRFVDSDDSTLLTYWIEAGCNTSNTEVWVRIPSLTTGSYIIYAYYDNSAATNAQASWTGNFLLLADTSCPSGWTQDTSYNTNFPYGATTSIGGTGGSESHTHATGTIYTEENSTASGYYADTYFLSGTGFPKSTHQHTVSVPLNSTSTLPAYLNMIFCSKASLDIPTGLITGFNTTSLPLGWTRFSALDDRFVRGNSTYGGGNATDPTHTHTTGTVTVSQDIKNSYYFRSGTIPVPASHTHTASSVSVSNETAIPSYYTLNYAKTTTSTASKGDMIGMTTAVPPLGWNSFSSITSKFPRGSSTPGTTGGGAHTHTITGTIDNSTLYTTYKTMENLFFNLPSGTHNHGTFSGEPFPSTALPPYIRTLFFQRKTSQSVSVGEEVSQNTQPTAPTSLLTEGQTNPPQIGDLTPEFSAIFNDPDTGDTGIYYEIEVNTNSSFTGTVMWDSNKTSMTSTANGARSPDLSYAGTALATNGTTYYWRIKFWDNSNAEGPWSATANFTMNTPPTAPTSLLTEELSNPNKIYDTTPEFSAIFNDPNGSDTGASYQIEVNTLSDFTGTVMWDSGKTSMTSTANGARSPDISYAGTTLTLNGTIYYWRIKFWDNYDTEGSWSSSASFRMSGPPNAPTELLFDGKTNPSWLSTQTPVLSAVHSDVNGDSATYYEVEINSSSDFTGVVKWDSGKQSMASTSTGSRSPDIPYGSTPLQNSGSTFYWRIRFWDTDDNVSPWSSTASFVETLNYTKMNGVGLEGLVIF